MPHRAVPPTPPLETRFLILFALTVVLPATVVLWLVGASGGDSPVDYADPVEHFVRLHRRRA